MPQTDQVIICVLFINITNAIIRILNYLIVKATIISDFIAHEIRNELKGLCRRLHFNIFNIPRTESRKPVFVK